MAQSTVDGPLPVPATYWRPGLPLTVTSRTTIEGLADPSAPAGSRKNKMAESGAPSFTHPTTWVYISVVPIVAWRCVSAYPGGKKDGR